MKFLQIKQEGPNSWGNQFLGTADLFDPPFCVSISKVSRTQILRLSVDLNAFCMIQEKFSENFEISVNERDGT